MRFSKIIIQIRMKTTGISDLLGLFQFQFYTVKDYLIIVFLNKAYSKWLISKKPQSSKSSFSCIVQHHSLCGWHTFRKLRDPSANT